MSTGDGRRVTLGLAVRTRRGGETRHETEYLDFEIDGRSLADLLGGTGGLIGCLGWGSAECEVRSIERLLLHSPCDLPSGRVPLYVCGECGDLACGAVTVRIERVGDAFAWSDFTAESTQSADPPLPWRGAPGRFVFDAAQYAGVLRGRADSLGRRPGLVARIASRLPSFPRA